MLDATDGYALYVPETDLAGVPADAIAVARAAARPTGARGCKLTLHFPSYLPVMQMGRNRALRETALHRLRHPRERVRRRPSATTRR